MIKRLHLLTIVLVVICTTKGRSTVWSTDVAPILFNSCASCHHSGGIAPFSLMTYQDAVNNANLISGAVQSKHMPPWPPDPSYKRLAHERLLSQAQIDKIVDWVNTGTAQGDPNLAPPQPTFNPNGDLPGTPDLIARIPTYTSAATTGDIYRCFVIPSGMLVDKFITAFEAIPGNRGIVHHVLVYADTTANHACAGFDAADPGPGYTSFGGVGTNAIMLGGWVPGTAPLKFPNGFGVKLPANADIVIQIHYPANTAGHVDSTEIHFFFSPTNNIRNVSIDPALNHFTSMTNGPLFIPANTTKTFHEEFALPSFIDITLMGVAPHMHLIGKNLSCYGVTPAGDTQNYIRINDWHFHWQGFYMFQKLQKIEGGTVAHADAFYNNTISNPDNPSNPPLDVSAGESTTDEMMIVYFIYTLYQPGDENIVIDTTNTTGVEPLNYYHGQQLLGIYPNPTSDQLVVKYHLDNKDVASIDIIDMQGKVVRTLMQNEPVESGYQAVSFQTGELANGLYQVRMKTSARIMTQKLLIQH